MFWLSLQGGVNATAMNPTGAWLIIFPEIEQMCVTLAGK